MSPTARTLKMLRDQGWLAEVVERWIPGAKIRKDLFGFVDIVAIKPKNFGTLGVQCTSGSNVSSRVAKIKESPNLRHLYDAGWNVSVYGWRKNATGHWVCRIVEVN